MDLNSKGSWFTRCSQYVFEWFARPEQRNHPVLAFKLESLLFIFGVAQIIMTFFFIMGLLYISHPSMLIVPPLCLSMGWVAMILLRTTGKMELTTHLLISSITGYITWYCWIANGFLETTFAWYVFMPILAAITSTPAFAAMWTGVIIVINIAGHVLGSRFGITNIIASEAQHTWVLMEQTAYFLCTGAVMFFLLKQQRISSDYLRERIISKQNLMRILVHDIANPLSTIHLMGQFLASGNSEFSSVTSGVRIEKNANRIMDIIQLIREMEGWEGGKKELQLVPLNLTTILEDVITQNQNRLSSKSIKLTTTFGQDEHVWGHPTMLSEQIVGNLLSNAIKFSHEGSTIELSVAPVSRHEVSVVIRDHGLGIPDKLQRLLFDPLAHTTRPGTAGEQGMGFGLPITKTCVELIGGRIQISSRSAAEYPGDHGTRAVLTLRRADSPQSRKDNS